MTKKYQNLCVKFITGNTNESENHLIEKWRKQSVDNEKEFQELKQTWMNFLHYHTIGYPDKLKAWNDLEERINDLPVQQAVQKSFTGIMDYFNDVIIAIKWRMAVSVIVILGIITLAIVVINRHQSESRRILTSSTMNTERKIVDFEDGSQATLNNASIIEFPELFNDSIRVVKLSGEAFFVIEKDIRPFVVVTSNARTTVLGTQFNVWARNNETRVVVKNGSVELSTNSKPESSVKLSADQISKVIRDSEPLAVSSIDSKHILGWLDGKIVFDNTTLDEIVKTIEMHYDSAVVLNDKSLAELTLTGTFQDTKLIDVMEMICKALELRYTKMEKGYTISSAADQL
ncbi:MAG: DUF4974 domain-containing protein [Melioribacteraceae bacterium]|nr:DUF4974 domain-containing protein [Melioribacteraceae bacterium]